MSISAVCSFCLLLLMVVGWLIVFFFYFSGLWFFKISFWRDFFSLFLVTISDRESLIEMIFRLALELCPLAVHCIHSSGATSGYYIARTTCGSCSINLYLKPAAFVLLIFMSNCIFVYKARWDKDVLCHFSWWMMFYSIPQALRKDGVFLEFYI